MKTLILLFILSFSSYSSQIHFDLTADGYRVYPEDINILDPILRGRFFTITTFDGEAVANRVSFKSSNPYTELNKTSYQARGEFSDTSVIKKALMNEVCVYNPNEQGIDSRVTQNCKTNGKTIKFKSLGNGNVEVLVQGMVFLFIPEDY